MKLLAGNYRRGLACTACFLLCLFPLWGGPQDGMPWVPAGQKTKLDQFVAIGKGTGLKQVTHWEVRAGESVSNIREEIHRIETVQGHKDMHVHMLADRFLIELHGDRETVIRGLQGMGFTLVSEMAFSPVLQVQISTRDIPGYNKALRRLRSAARGDRFSVYPDYLARVESTLPNDPSYATSQVDLDLIGAPEAWDVTTGSEEIVVAMIDSGMQVDHVDLAGNLFVNPMEIPGNGLDDDGNGLADDVSGWDFQNNDNLPEDTTGHGTAIAGVIGAVGNNGIGIAGTSWRCRLLPLKAGNWELAWSALIQAMDYVVWLKQRGVRIVAVNNSYAGSISDPADMTAFSNAVSRIEQAGILFVAAAGNNGHDNDAPGGANHLYPSDLPNENIISVAATNNNDELIANSNYGTVSVDLAAPGASVYTTHLNNGYTSMTGTSLSCARVTGLAALVWARNPDFRQQDVKSILIDTGATLLDLVGKLKHPVRIDAAAALQAALTFPLVSWQDGEGTLFMVEGNSVLLEAEASDADGYVVSVDFLVDGAIVGSDSNGIDGWTWNWPNPTGSGTLQLRVTDDDGQKVTTWTRPYAVVSPFDYWRSSHWGDGFSNLGEAGEHADPDKDGIVNIWEYAIGSDPISAGSPAGRAGYPVPVRFDFNGTRYFGVDFRLRTTDPSLQLIAELSRTALDSGWAGTSPDYYEVIQDADPYGIQTFRLGFVESGEGVMFVRLGLQFSPGSL